jgi:hypothetical protein
MAFQYTFRAFDIPSWEIAARDLVENRDLELESSLSYNFSNLDADNLTSGTVPSARIAGSYTGITGVGTLTVGSIPATLLTGIVASARISGSYTGITQTGTLSTLDVTGTFEVSPSVNHTLFVGGNRVGVRTNTPQGAFDVVGTAFATAFTATGTVTANLFDGSGASLTSIPAAQLTGTVADARLSSSYTNIGSITTSSTITCGAYVYLNTSGQNYICRSPTTGTGNAAHWVSVLGVYQLYRNTSTIREKENIQSVGNLLNPGMIDKISVQLWNRKTAPGIPEIGPMAEEMDAISPFLSTRGLEQDENGEYISSPVDGINSNTWLSLLTIGMQDLRHRLQQLETP